MKFGRRILQLSPAKVQRNVTATQLLFSQSNISVYLLLYSSLFVLTCFGALPYLLLLCFSLLHNSALQASPGICLCCCSAQAPHPKFQPGELLTSLSRLQSHLSCTLENDTLVSTGHSARLFYQPPHPTPV